MLKYRLIAGTTMIALMVAVLVFDGRFAPYFPCLFLVTMLAGFTATWELQALLPEPWKPDRTSVVPGVLGILAANWYEPIRKALPSELPAFADAWQPVLLMLTLVSLCAFFHEMYHRAGETNRIPKIAFTLFAFVYLGLFPSFLLRLRWLDSAIDPLFGAWLLALVIFVPKGGDIGAYFTGRFLGRFPMAPKLSPKKTWEGFAGGLLASMLAAFGINLASGNVLFRYGVVEAAGFGLVVGIAGVLGDLAESMLKRDCGAKDAAKSIPGFGGFLDVVDSILFAAPVAYVWLTRN